MEPQQPQKAKTIKSIIIILLALGLIYVLFSNYDFGQLNLPSSNNDDTKVVIENTPTVNGELTAPIGLPNEIPIELGNVVESATAKYPEQNAQQFSVSYLSSDTATQKYSEYKAYMAKAGYQVSEGDTNSSLRTLLGTKEDSNLSVVISVRDGKTLVQLAYVLKSTQ